MKSAITVVRSPLILRPDPRRLITKPYLISDQAPFTGKSRAERMIDRITALSPAEVGKTLEDLRIQFTGRHADLDRVFMQGFAAAVSSVPEVARVPEGFRLLIGAYFVHEYSIEGAALTNPSIVPAPDQGSVGDGSLEVIVSLRAVGEGHISAIEFRNGVVGSDGAIDLDVPGPPIIGDRRPPTFQRAAFAGKLDEMGVLGGLVGRILESVDDRFTLEDLDRACADLRGGGHQPEEAEAAIHSLHWLASSNYETTFPAESTVSERVLFPSGPTESRGMEDARFVPFVEADRSMRYFATYTAFDGLRILPQLIETTDFRTFRIATIGGTEARNKGMAIFPRLVGGKYAALGRADGESNYLMWSDDIRVWNESKQIQVPTHPWDLMQIGNAGSPLETEAGWLTITHGVGPMRRYTLGAILLDLDDPSQVIGSLDEPLLEPEQAERDGYVPNVVYSCGSLIHGDRLIIAYGASDTFSSFASVSVDSLLTQLTRG
ncbi:MAG: glycoside hydrolase family 130 protein [Acidimicrobiia bacterium]